MISEKIQSLLTHDWNILWCEKRYIQHWYRNNARDHDIMKSYMIGDSDSDIQAGNAMQLNTVKVNNIYTLAKWADEFL